MTEPVDQEINIGPGLEFPPWDPVAITRQRATALCAERDRAVQDLRQSMPGKEILTTFGIDLDQMEG